MEGQHGYVQPHTKLQPHELQELVVRALVQALSQPHFEKGFVLDGLHSK